ncbi:hypothetical protein ACFYQ5_28110 [Streptomyces sp. NPDC005794]|uniref:hypothetical protein n=1 Tax=Streptomyces sp. NPDC005794 TaxID=3364733 RepID=UPI0036C9714B
MDDWTTSHDRVITQRRAEGWMFLIEAVRDLRTTGAIAPSGKALAHALTEPVRAQSPHPLAVLEAGAGTGSITRALIPQLSQGSRLDVVEANPRFAARLSKLVTTHPSPAARSGQATPPWRPGRPPRPLPAGRTNPRPPHFAGATRLPYRHIAPYSITAACLWATAEISAGYAAAASLQRVLTLGAPVLAGIAVITLASVMLWRRHFSSDAQPALPTRPDTTGPDTDQHQGSRVKVVPRPRPSGE